MGIPKISTRKSKPTEGDVFKDGRGRWWFSAVSFSDPNKLPQKWGPYPDGYRTEILAQRAYVQHLKSCYWRGIWKQAYDNMPIREATPRRVKWVPREAGTTEVSEFIHGVAKKKMQIIDGLVHEKKIEIGKTYQYGQINLLARIMFTHKLPHMHVRNCMGQGHELRDPKKTELLLQLAGPKGREIALAFVEKLGIRHRYK